MKKKNIGFTLVELLAVIVILAIILAIAVPSISGLINSSTRNAFEMDAKMLTTAIKYKLMEDDSLNLNTINETNVESILKVSDDNYQTVTVSTLRGEPYIVLFGKNKWAGLVASGSYSSMSVSDSSNYTTTINQLGYDAEKGTNEPKLMTGMTPIKWNGTTWVNTTTSDSDWYDYDTTDKKWANARTTDGSMWVWIPRYVYRITTNWHTATAGTIDVQFSMGIDDTRGGTITLDTGTTSDASNNKWTNHPAFTFGTTELTGIWVAKFEASGTTSAVDFKPNVVSLRSTTISDMFTATRNMETNTRYGWGTSGTNLDTHMMKNVEWGAVAYLSESTYGQNTNEIWINPANNYTTGCAGDSVSSAATTGCLRTYETTNGVKASTTGNIYGIYDMSGGSYEYTAAYVNNGDSSLVTNGSSVISADSKYKDIYTVTTDNLETNYSNASSKKGDAVYETSSSTSYTESTSWFADFSSTPSTNYPWFTRSGYAYNDTSAGTFGFRDGTGGAGSSGGFRSVVLVGTGL